MAILNTNLSILPFVRTLRQLLFYLYIALDIISDFRQIALHTIGILGVDNLQQLLELRTNLRHLVVGVRVKQDFLQQVVIFVQHTLGNAHVALESGTRCILVLHDGGKDEGRHKGD